MTAPLPDAAPANWVDRHAPTGLRPWLKLGRFDRPAPMWLLVLPGWQGAALAAAMAGRWPDPWLLAKIFAGAALMRAAGCAYNDIVDADIDAKVARTAGRPIPAGQISKRQAWGFLIGCCLAAFAILMSMNLLAVSLGVGSLALVAAYPFMKRITWWPQAWLGLTFNWGALLGFAAASGSFQALAWIYLLLQFGDVAFSAISPNQGYLALPALLLYASGVFWTLGYDTIYAIQDLEDDALAGVKSSARRLGSAAPRAVAGFYLIATLLLLAAAWTAHLAPATYGLIAVAGLHMGWQASRVRVDDPTGALRLFKSNAITGLVAFAAFALGGL